MRLEAALKLSKMAITTNMDDDRTYYATKMAVVEERYGHNGEAIYAGPVIDQNDVIGRTDWRPLGVMEERDENILG